MKRKPTRNSRVLLVSAVIPRVLAMPVGMLLTFARELPVRLAGLGQRIVQPLPDLRIGWTQQQADARRLFDTHIA
ncbi:hypothetical protein VL15_38260 [Burkholderia cepacia]|uniref:Uncharacterized protein n=1 Tax=Burkholderia cepacia TaxID=292 RepID=A0A0J5VQ17_BURCE|nr:hypothetical protein VL15_38260 [Burkholderia cepacia]